MCSGFLGCAEKLVNVAFAITDVDASCRVTEKLRGLLDIFEPPDAFLLLDGDACRIDLLLERGSAFEFLPGPEFDGRQPEWQPFGRHREARMHQNAANRVRSQTPRLVPSAVYALRYPDRVRVLSLIGELGRVMEHKDGTIGGGRAAMRRLKVTGEDVRLADPVVGEKAIGRLGVGPILADQRNALPHGAPDLRHQLAEPLVQALVRKTAASKLAIKPCVSSSVHWHRSPAIRCQIRNHGRFLPRNTLCGPLAPSTKCRN